MDQKKSYFGLQAFHHLMMRTNHPRGRFGLKAFHHLTMRTNHPRGYFGLKAFHCLRMCLHQLGLAAHSNVP